ncbi:MAG: TIGR01777 family oxidoreductase [Oligoflexia bacterium]|nr:TIGR01777 family oxidoreductase [Oligoflexia bacterium]
MRSLVTGATGFIGRSLGRRIIESGGELLALMRDPIRARESLPVPYDAYAWNMMEGAPFEQALQGADVVFHLAGEPVDGGRWTAARRKKIRDSRVIGTRNLVEGLRRMKGPRPTVLVSASAVGYYGDRGEELLTEEVAPGEGFLPEVCAAWEHEAAQATELGLRVVSLRFGMVLGKEGGALPRILPPFRAGWGGPLGSGEQWMSWIHLEDAVALLEFVARNPEARGPINAVAPSAVTNEEFTRALAAWIGKPARLPVPALALRIGLGKMAELLLSSQRVSPAKAQGLGFRFRYERLEDALAAIGLP